MEIGGNKYEASVLVGYTSMNETLLYDVQDLKPTNYEIKEKKAQPKLAGNESDTRKTVESSGTIIAENSEKSIGEVKKSLTPEQEEYFKDSVVRDETGNLKVMYHGTSKGGHTMFDPYGKANHGL